MFAMACYGKNLNLLMDGDVDSQVYCLLWLKDGLCPSLRSFTIKHHKATVAMSNVLHLLLLLPDILRSRVLCSVTVMHHQGSGLQDDYDTGARLHTVVLDCIDRGLLCNWELHGYLPDDHSYLSSFHSLESFTLATDFGCHNVLEVLNSLSHLQTLNNLSLLDLSPPSINLNMLRNACPALVELSISGQSDWMHLVFESPVRSGFLDPRRGNCEPDQSIHFSNLGQPATEPTTTGPHRFGCLQKTGCNRSFAQSFLISRKPVSQVTMTRGFLISVIISYLFNKLLQK
jgi:hypothetical protein